MAKSPPKAPKNSVSTPEKSAVPDRFPVFGDTNRDGKLSPDEDAALNVTLGIDAGQLDQVISHATSLRDAGVDQLNVSGGKLSLNLAQANALLGSDQKFSAQDDLSFIPNADVTLQVGISEEDEALSQASDLRSLGVDHMQLASGVTSDAGAHSLVAAGIDFAINNHTALDVSQAAGTHLSTSLTDLQKLGVDAVTVSGQAMTIGSLSVDLSAGDHLSTGGLPLFGDANRDGTLAADEEAALNVTLNIDAEQINDVIAHATQLRSAGIDQININGGKLSLDFNQASMMLGADYQFSAKDDLRFTAATDVTLAVAANETNHAAYQAHNLHSLGVDHVHLASGFITDAGAHDMVAAGLDFIANDGITLDINQAAGTHLSTSLTDLQKLGVNSVTLSGEAATVGSITIDLGNNVNLSDSSVSSSLVRGKREAIPDNDISPLLGNHAEKLVHNGIDMLGGFTTPDKYGDLLNVLMHSGVGELVTQSVNVRDPFTVDANVLTNLQPDQAWQNTETKGASDTEPLHYLSPAHSELVLNATLLNESGAQEDINHFLEAIDNPMSLGETALIAEDFILPDNVEIDVTKLTILPDMELSDLALAQVNELVEVKIIGQEMNDELLDDTFGGAK